MESRRSRVLSVVDVVMFVSLNLQNAKTAKELDE